MSVATKLFLILLFVAIVPLGVFAETAMREQQRALEHELAALHAKTAEHGAHATEAELRSAQRTIEGLASAIPWAELSGDERAGALRLVYSQLDDVAVVSLLDSHGQGVGSSIYGADQRHPPVAGEELSAFAPTIPFTSAPGIGEPFTAPGQPPLVAIAVPVAGPAHARWVLAAALSLRSACEELATASPPGVATQLVDARGARLCGGAARGDVLTATSPLANGWRVVAEQPRDQALASLHRVRVQSLVWLALGVIGAIAAGLVLTQAIRRPLRQLAAGAEAVAAGNYGHRVALASRDELGQLARSFDRMAGDLEKRDAEIRRWNDELQQRVDARTAELKEAQDQLLQSRKLAAMAALGAGVAHEINNPLAGVVGLAQVLLARKDALDERTVRSLTSIEREALRIREIVDRVASLARASIDDAVRIDVTGVVEAVAQRHADRIAAAHIEVERTFAASIPPVLGSSAQLEHALGQIVDNSLRAMPSGGRLRLAVRSVEGELVAIEIADTGRGIAPELLDKVFEPFFTTKDWQGTGLGLSIAHRIVEAHHGRIRAASRPGEGTTMTVTLPAARVAAHLA